jgi:hypothetical protein
LPLGYDRDDFTNRISPLTLYSDTEARAAWVQRVRESIGQQHGGLVSYPTDLVRRGAIAPLHVLDLSRAHELPDHDDYLVLGVLVDITSHFVDQQLALSRIAAYEEILNHEWLTLGVHRIDASARIRFMNRYEQGLLGINQEWVIRTIPAGVKM